MGAWLAPEKPGRGRDRSLNRCFQAATGDHTLVSPCSDRRSLTACRKPSTPGRAAKARYQPGVPDDGTRHTAIPSQPPFARHDSTMKAFQNPDPAPVLRPSVGGMSQTTTSYVTTPIRLSASKRRLELRVTRVESALLPKHKGDAMGDSSSSIGFLIRGDPMPSAPATGLSSCPYHQTAQPGSALERCSGPAFVGQTSNNGTSAPSFAASEVNRQVATTRPLDRNTFSHPQAEIEGDGLERPLTSWSDWPMRSSRMRRTTAMAGRVASHTDEAI